MNEMIPDLSLLEAEMEIIFPEKDMRYKYHVMNLRKFFC